MSFSLLYVTHPSKPEANVLTAKLLSQHLIACANFFPIESVYFWEGALTRTEEIVTIYKAPTANVEKIQEYIIQNHKYEIPCIIKLTEVTANDSYENWITSECPKNYSCENL